MIIAKALTIAFEKKIKENLSELIVCSNATSNKLVKQMRKWQHELGMGPDEMDSRDLELPKEGTSQNMVFIFCQGLFSSSDCGI